jgi:hypothetical protein
MAPAPAFVPLVSQGAESRSDRQEKLQLESLRAISMNEWSALFGGVL